MQCARLPSVTLLAVGGVEQMHITEFSPHAAGDQREHDSKAKSAAL